MSIEKKPMKDKTRCKVNFNLSKEIADSEKTAHVVGEFNDWSTSATPMKRKRNGDFSATLDLMSGRSYEFRYLLGQEQWENDPDADAQIPTPFGDSYNSVIRL